MALVCVPIMVEDAASALDAARRAKELGADLVEFRLDELFHGEGDDAGVRAAVAVISGSPIPCIATCRIAAEGGSYDGDEAARVALYERLAHPASPAEHPPTYIDIELAARAVSANARLKIALASDAHSAEPRPGLILSMHDFQGRPGDLSRRLLELRASPARLAKIAYRARSLRDSLDLLDIAAEADRPTIALGMGEFGLLSRVLSGKFGAFLTFASIGPGQGTAPGQPTIRELLDLYRFRSIGRDTGVYGVIGWPVGHSLSPHIHNAGFERVGHDGVYLPLPIAPGYESLKGTLGELLAHPRLSFSGCSVTIPHKEHLLRLAGEMGWEISDEARAIGAANTLAARAGVVRVFNTDARAVAALLRTAPPRRVAIIGAGGVARAAAHAALELGAAVRVCARTPAHAENLAHDLSHPGRDIRADDPGAWISWAPDVVINATPVGMRGGPDPEGMPLPAGNLDGLSKSSPTIFDTVYMPRRTPLVDWAKRRSLPIIEGASMFVEQAALQFQEWTGAPPPRGAFEAIVRDAQGDP